MHCREMFSLHPVLRYDVKVHIPAYKSCKTLDTSDVRLYFMTWLLFDTVDNIRVLVTR